MDSVMFLPIINVVIWLLVDMIFVFFFIVFFVESVQM